MTTRFLPLIVSLPSLDMRPDARARLTGEVTGRAVGFLELVGEVESVVDTGGGPVHQSGSGPDRLSND
jgi:hypothetical protein